MAQNLRTCTHFQPGIRIFAIQFPLSQRRVTSTFRQKISPYYLLSPDVPLIFYVPPPLSRAAYAVCFVQSCFSLFSVHLFFFGPSTFPGRLPSPPNFAAALPVPQTKTCLDALFPPPPFPPPFIPVTFLVEPFPFLPLAIHRSLFCATHSPFLVNWICTNGPPRYMLFTVFWK